MRPFQSKIPIRLPTAKVRFHVEGLDEWEELVALSPSERGKESEVLYGLDLKSARGLDVVILANKLSQAGVNRVTTRSMGRQEALEEKETAELVASEEPKVRTVDAEAVKKAVEIAQTVKVACKKKKKAVVAETVKKAVEIAQTVVGKLGAGEGGTAEDRPAGKPKPVSVLVEVISSEKGTGEEKLAADRPVSDSEPVALDVVVEDEWPDLESLEEKDLEMEEELPDLAEIAEEEVDLEEEIEFCLRESKGKLEDLEVPPVKKGLGSRPELVKEVLVDPTPGGSWQRRESRVLVGIEACCTRQELPIVKRWYI